MVSGTGPRLRVTGVDGLPLLRLDHPTLGGPRALLKEVLDRVGAAVVLLLVAPLLASCAAAVRRDGGPVLERQTFLGRDGGAFRLLTFRTVDATGAVTPVGRVLRRHRLDGLPQLLNVLGGSMAVVGPRPDPARATRPLVKPGIVGLGDQPILRYVDRWTPARDARILLRALGAALRR
jgi:lipopolysaccharide/colanic/teichoic acid biosynthesis glycosyltransferase